MSASSKTRVSLFLCLVILYSTALPAPVWAIEENNSVTFAEIANLINGDIPGAGTIDSPYLISSAEQLVQVSTLINSGDAAYASGYYQLVNDLDLSSILNWTPIGLDMDHAFSGFFDGQNYQISGLTIDMPDMNTVLAYYGLFGYNSGTVSNLSLLNCDIQIYKYSTAYAGSIAGLNTGVIDNCAVSGSISGSACVGLITGYSIGSISSCLTSGSLSGLGQTGGISGFSSGSVLTCSCDASIAGGSNSGGIVGTNEAGTIERCYFSGENSGFSSIGGISGFNSGLVANCFNIGSLYGNDLILFGGIAGHNDGTVSSSYNAGKIIGTACSGSIVGQNDHTIVDCYFLADANIETGTGEQNAIGYASVQMTRPDVFIGFDFADTWMFQDGQAYPYPVLQGVPFEIIPENTTEFAGGRGTIFDPYLINTRENLLNVRRYPNASFMLVSDIVFTADDFSEGGIAFNHGSGWLSIGLYSRPFSGVFDGNGHTIQGLVQNGKAADDPRDQYGFISFNRGTIKNLGLAAIQINCSEFRTNEYNTGGIAGNNSYGRISQCYTTGSIVGQGRAGGITASIGRGGIIENCFSNCFISTAVSGGITTSNSRGTIQNCYFAGSLVGATSYGGICTASTMATTTSCYYLDIYPYGKVADITGVTACTLGMMQTSATYTGFDFSNIWDLPDGSGYPLLRLKSVELPPEEPENYSEYAGGNGSAYHPYLISTKSQLANISLNLRANYKLAADLVFTAEDFAINGPFYNNGAGWQPLGTVDQPFRGTFDGAGHSITGIFQDQILPAGTIANLGLFGCNLGNISNLRLIDCQISMQGSESANIGSIAGLNDGLIYGCSSTGIISGIMNVGGIAGLGYKGRIDSCYNSATVSGSTNTGGIIGNSYTAISNCYNSGNIFGETYSGGIVGKLEFGQVISSYNVGHVAGTSYGAICGSYISSCLNCYALNMPRVSVAPSSGITVCSVDQMRSISTYTGFDFDQTWIMPDTPDYPFPQLRSVVMAGFTENTTEYVGGRGTPFDPFRISNADQLDHVRYNLDAFFVLQNDIDLLASSDDWQPIGDADQPFRGCFDGQGYRVAGLTINQTVADAQYFGLFGYSSGMICNLQLEEIDFSLQAVSKFVGGLVGRNVRGLIQNCRVSGQIRAQNNSLLLGGCAGASDGMIDNCYNQATVIGYQYVGGITGSNGGTIKNCRNAGDILGQAPENTSSLYFGGICGQNYHVVQGSSNIGQIAGYRYVGGITGSLRSTSSISKISLCYNTGAVDGTKSVGGIAGYCMANPYDQDDNNDYNEIASCYNLGLIKGDSNIGGLAGESKFTWFSDCYNAAAVTGATATGSLVGLAASIYLDACYFVNTVRSIGSGTATGVGIACTPAQMQSQDTFTKFDFTNVWIMPDTPGSTPFLRSLYIACQSIEVSDFQMVVGESRQASLRVIPWNAVPPKCTWISQDPDIVSIDANGLITAKARGSATIVAQMVEGGYSASGLVEVIQPVIGISLDVQNLCLPIGYHHKLSATVFPADANNQTVIWSSDRPEIASVSDDGTVAGISQGEAQIWATTEDGRYSAVCSITTGPAVSSIEIQGAAEVTRGQSATYTAAILPADALVKTVSWDVIAGTGNAVISEAGVLSGMDAGTVVVRATAQDSTGTIGLYPVLIKEIVYTVILDAMNGDSNKLISVAFNSKIPVPTAPARPGYVFVGWFTGSNNATLWQFSSDLVTSNLTLYAQWLESPVSGLKAISAGYTSAKITWTAASGASGYEVWRRLWSTGVFTLVSTQTTTSLINTGLSTNKTYYYKVRAYRIVGTTKVYSNDSAIVSATPIPATPTGFKAVSAGYNSARLTWTAVSGASGYEVYRKLWSTGVLSLVSTQTTASFLNSGLATNKTYYYKVRAYRMVGTTKVYSKDSVFVGVTPVPAAPTGLKVVSGGSKTAKVTWTAVSGASGYEVWRKMWSSGTYVIVSTQTATSLANYGLAINKTYYYKVRAYRMIGTTKVYGPDSAVVAYTPLS